MDDPVSFLEIEGDGIDVDKIAEIKDRLMRPVPIPEESISLFDFGPLSDALSCAPVPHLTSEANMLALDIDEPPSVPVPSKVVI